jgi:hypothetical protein
LRSVLTHLLAAGALVAACCVLAPVARADHGSPTLVQGQVQAVHQDYFDTGTSTDRYSLATPAGKRLKLESRKDQLGLRNGTRVALRGQVDDGTLAVTEEAVTAAAEAQPTAAAALPASPVKVAVILLNFRNNTTQPFTAADARTTVFTGTSSVNAYYRENSFGQITLTGKLRSDGDVFGWYTSSRDAVSCDYTQWATDARQLAQQSGVDLTGYDKLIYVHPRISACSWAGLAYLGGRDAWINGYLNTHTVGHEVGHLLGVHHASSTTCLDAAGNRTPVSTSCTPDEYGDPFSIMGGSPRQLNGFHKAQLGFVPPAGMQTVSAAGAYTLAPLESAGGGVQVLRIPRTRDGGGNVTEYYYVDYRRPSGLFDDYAATDNVVNGVGVRLAPDLPVVAQSRLLDLTPANGTFTDSALTAGSTFTDPTTGVSFSVSALSDAAATVRVNDLLVANLEAESFSYSSPQAAVVQTQSASGGRQLNLYSNTSVTRQFTAPKASRVVIRARGGEYCDGWPHLTARLDGTQFASADVAQLSWKNQSFSVPVSAGTHTLTIAYTNEYKTAVCDRNLRIDYARLYAMPAVVAP